MQLFSTIRLPSDKTDLHGLLPPSILHAAFRRMFNVRNFRLVVLLPEEYKSDPREAKRAVERAKKASIVGPPKGATRGKFDDDDELGDFAEGPDDLETSVSRRSGRKKILRYAGLVAVGAVTIAATFTVTYFLLKRMVKKE